MKALRYILLGLVALAVIGLLCYQGFVSKDLESGDLVRGLLILAGLILAMVRPRRSRRVSNKKALYQKAYQEYIQNPFSEEPRLEKQFYNAVDDYNQGKPAAAVSKLNKLRKDCQRSADVYSVTVFMALCYDDMRLYSDAIQTYQAALNLRPSSSLASNMGLCYYNIGDKENAEKAYRQAINLKPNNAFAHNNMASLYFREGDYAKALDHAETALQANGKLAQALSLAAVCCALLGHDSKYQDYYRRAVSCGYDGNKIKSTIRALNAEL